jgi:hypothetical protein
MKMNNMLENHPRDTRSPNEKEENIIDLDILQDVLEESIGSYAIQNPQNIYDEEFEQILRLLEFSRGLKNHLIVLAPDGIIRFLSPKFPSTLLLEIHNALVGIVVFDAPEENQ